MGRKVGRAALWVLSVLLVSAGGGMLHSAFTGYSQEPAETFIALVCILTGAAIYLHVLRYPTW